MLLQVKIYSRNCEDKTAMFPDVCASILAACRHSETPSSFIVDSELVAVDRADNNRLRAFQDLSTRCCAFAPCQLSLLQLAALEKRPKTLVICLFEWISSY